MSYKVEINSRNLDGYFWQSNSLRFASKLEALRHLLALENLAIASDHDGCRVVESPDPVNAIWDYDEGRYRPVEEKA